MSLLFGNTHFMEIDMAKKETIYEWRVNYRDEHGDVYDIDFFDTYESALKRLQADADQGAADIELTKTVGDEDEGIHYRDYATVIDGKLPEYFDEGDKVNKAHHAEVARAHKAA